MITTTTVAISFELPEEHEAEQTFRMSHDMRDWTCTDCVGRRTYTKIERLLLETKEYGQAEEQ